MISEHEINQVMSDTGMDYMQARNHVKCRQIHRDIVQSAHAALMRSLTERAQANASATSSGNVATTILCLAIADPTTGALTNSVPHVVNQLK